MLLVGGGVASVRCARALRRHGFDGSVMLVGAERRLPYNRPPLSKELLRDDLPDELVLAEPDGWYARRGIEARVGTRVVELDAADQTALLDDGGSVAFDRCLIATGAEPRRLPVAGGEHAQLLRTLDDARRLRTAAVAARPGGRVTVVGGGFIGVELASSLAGLGLRPTVVELAGRLWGGALGDALAEWAAERLRGEGIQLRLGAAVERLEDGAAWVAGDRIDHDLAVAGIGVVPRVELAAEAGLAVSDGIGTDAEQRTAHPAVWAAGDVARVAGRRVEHWHAAREAGERAALSMLGQPVPPLRAPWLFTEVAGRPVDVFGMATGWDEERWVRDGSVLAYLEGERVVQVAVIGAALASDPAREIVERGASARELEATLVD